MEMVKVFVETIGNIGEFPRGADVHGSIYRIIAGMQVTHPGDRLNYVVIDSRGNRVGAGSLAF
jgi:hypothetical protein